MIGWTRRNRERDEEDREQQRRFNVWWAKATPRQRKAYKDRATQAWKQMERDEVALFFLLPPVILVVATLIFIRLQ